MNESFRNRQCPEVGTLLKKNFLAGLFVLVPFLVIAWLLTGFIAALWGIHDYLPEDWQPSALSQDPSWAFAINTLFVLAVGILLALGISFLGWISKLWLGQRILNLLSDLIQKIPVIRSVYSGLDQLLKTLASSGGSQQFNRVVYIEYPRRGIWALAFVTGTAKGPNAPEGHLNVYIPTTPNPTSGFHLIVPEAEVRESQLKVEDAFKTILSLGIAQPENKRSPLHG